MWQIWSHIAIAIASLAPCAYNTHKCKVYLDSLCEIIYMKCIMANSFLSKFTM